MVLIFWVGSCARNPVSGKQELMLLNETDEIKLGGETDAQVVQEYGVYKDAELTAYLGKICQRMGKLSHRPNLSFQFKLLDVSVVNAFAVPGGYVYLTRGILASMDNEAELAGVMGHEIGHITARHSAQQYSRAQLAQIGLIVPEVLGIPGVSALAQLGVGMLFLRFSRDNERQADDLGVEYSSKAGYDATQMATFFETLERMNPGSDQSGLPAWFSTHPSPEDRVGAVRKRAREWRQKLSLQAPKVNRDIYLRGLDGLVFGEDPRQGYVADHVFYHPGLLFQFPVPVGWKLNNTPSQVQMVSQGKDAVILFSIGAGSSPREAARTFVSKTKGDVIRSEALQVNGLTSQRMVSDLRTDQGLVRVLSYFLQKEKRIFVFHGLTSRNQYPKFEGSFDSAMRQFQELTDPRRIDVQPNRIRLRTTDRADTLENALRFLDVSDKKLQEVVLLNGGDPKERVPAETLLKVVERGR
jgi:predicted Zn-dependent protease